MEITWHGHSTFCVTVDDTTFLIDPFFDNPNTDVDPADHPTPDVVLLTHGHADHIAHVGHFTDATVAGTPEITGFVEDEHGAEDTVGFNLGGTVELGDAYVTMHRADHTNGLNTGYEHEVGMPAGYVISDTKPTQVSDAESETFYHAGDTALMTEMRDVVGPFLEPDVAALPAGDHFTMGPMQAAIAADWLNVDYAVPMHYDSFPPIEIDVDDFRRELRATGNDVEPVVLGADESFEFDAS